MTTIAAILREKGSDVETVAPDATLDNVIARLALRRIGAVVVSADGAAIAGILSERDIVRSIASHGAAVLSREVSEAMTAKVITCTPEQSIDDVMGVMTTGRFRHVPVVSEGKLAGLVSIGDVVKYKIAEATAEAEALKNYIAAG